MKPKDLGYTVTSIFFCQTIYYLSPLQSLKHMNYYGRIGAEIFTMLCS